MGNRTHETEDALTGAKTSARNTSPEPVRPRGPLGAYPDSRIDSIGGGPSGTDRDDRTGEGQARGVMGSAKGSGPDEFLSSEVNDRTALPMKDSKTRS